MWISASYFDVMLSVLFKGFEWDERRMNSDVY